MNRDEPLYTQMLYNRTSEEYKKVQEKLDTEELLKFSDDKTPNNFLTLIWNFFYLKFPTWYVKDNAPTVKSNNYQTSTGRSRSVVDFYLIQKYYLRKPLNFEECCNFFFTSLPRHRIDEALLNKISKDIRDTAFKFAYGPYCTYFCSTVQRNVFSSAGIGKGINELVKFNKLLVDNKYGSYLIKGKKTIKPEFNDLIKKAVIIAQEAKKAAIKAEQERLTKLKVRIEQDAVKWKELLASGKPILKLIQCYYGWGGLVVGDIVVQTRAARSAIDYTNFSYLNKDGLLIESGMDSCIKSKHPKGINLSNYTLFEYVTVLEEQEKLAKEQVAKAATKTPTESVEF